MSKDGPEYVVTARLPRDAVSVMKVGAPPVDIRHEFIENDLCAELRLKIIDVPRIVVARKTRDRNAAIRPLGEQCLETHETAWDEMPILDETLEKVSEKNQRRGLRLERSKAGDEVLLLSSLGIRRAFSEVRV